MSSVINEIKKGYEELLDLFKEFDSQVDTSRKTGRKLDVNFRETKESLQEKLPYWRTEIGIAVDKALSNEKSMFIETKKRWIIEQIYSSFTDIERFFTADYPIYVKIKEHRSCYNDFTNLRNVVWSLCSYLEETMPNVIELEKQVDILFKLRDNDFETISEELEKIDEIESMKEKCLVARTALEQVINDIVNKEGEDPKQRFFGNIHILKKIGILDNQDRKVIGALYSFISQIVHGEKEDTTKESMYAINGVYNHIDFTVEKYLDWKKKES